MRSVQVLVLEIPTSNTRNVAVDIDCLRVDKRDYS